MLLLPGVRFRLHEEDRAKYGDDWYVYDERALLRLPLGKLREIERQTGLSVPQIMNGARAGYVDCALAQVWIARRLAGVTEDFKDLDVLVYLLDVAPKPVPGGDADPPEGSTSSPDEEAPPNS